MVALVFIIKLHRFLKNWIYYDLDVVTTIEVDGGSGFLIHICSTLILSAHIDLLRLLREILKGC